jgi:dinuclear metal center YbgI/SA1388 family protein
MDATELISRIESRAPLSMQAAWDASGVQIAGTTDEVSRLAVMLDPLPELVGKALADGADFILAHHPLGIKPRLPAVRDGFHEILRLTLGAGAWLYAAHTSLDARIDGPVSWLADELHLDEKRPLVVDGETPLGFVGELPAAMSVDEFSATLVRLTGRSPIALAGPRPGAIRRVACLPGSGGDFASAAARAGADVHVTGDLKHHQALEAPVLVVDVGHFSLEEEMMRRLAASLATELASTDVAVEFYPGRDPFEHTSG